MNNYSRILSGMRPTGRLHLGHYHGAIKNWISLQYEHECYFMVADIHALTTGYDDTNNIASNIYEMVIDWLACGVDPAQSSIFVQSHVKEHAELHLLLSMITPLSWLERVPTYKDMIEKLAHKEIDTYGFLGYPLLQSADILLYNAKYVPVGEDQLSHVELTREVARRFNYLYGREEGFEEKALVTMRKLGAKKASLYEELLVKYQQDGDDEALEKARFLLQDAINLSHGELARLSAFLENKSRVILTEPQALITNTPKLLGLDGQKMSKSYSNTIMLREDLDSTSKKIKVMQTDPARVRRTDSGDPARCPVWQLHKVYSTDEVCKWVVDGCKTAGIGCLDCKAPLIEAINIEQDKFRINAEPFLNDHNMVRNILADGAEKASAVASRTLKEVKQAINLDY
jgi:tryptophanyl-tRNA synthetase